MEVAVDVWPVEPVCSPLYAGDGHDPRGRGGASGRLALCCPRSAGGSVCALSQKRKGSEEAALGGRPLALWDWRYVRLHTRLRILYTKILDVLDQIPKNAAYRKYTEQITNDRLATVKAEQDIKKLEDRLQLGQIEEVILQAESELSLARKMIQWKPWEPLVEEPPANQWKWPI
ncbi:NADH dehydrogenase [ubiquinone] 1 alpha subcomplex subunit 5 isoform X1 [Cavia porcellus]|uniref:NADH dehydrogenase [ubiquinone] 1 alpha subcomplex subunit 5 isoform X1 n=1 Tax=Cavia porcellus TaxID=10141 RepID=UPI002FE19335